MPLKIRKCSYKKYCVLFILIIAACLLASCSNPLTIPFKKIFLKAPPDVDSKPDAGAKKDSNFLKGKKVGFIGILPLPNNYPPGFFKNEKVFSGEIYTKQADDSLGSHTIFIPMHYRDIIESTILTSMKFEGINIVRYPTITAAREDGCSYILFITPYEFHVEDESKAVIKLNFGLMDTSIMDFIWEGLINKETNRSDLPSTLEDNLIVTVGSHKYNFQPQCALLSEGVYGCVKDFIRNLSKDVEEKK